MNPQLGQTQYLKRNLNGQDVYQALHYGGNIPFGYQIVGKDEFITGTQKRLSELQANPSLQGGSGDWGNIAPLQKFLQDAQSEQGVSDPNYIDPSFSKFQPNAPTSSEQYHTPEEKARQAGIPSNLGGTGTPTALPLNRANTIGSPNTYTTPTPSVSQGTPINISGNLMRGSKGEEVKRLQEALNASGIGVNLKIDGDFGPATEAAVRAYQSSKNIKSDGIVGQQTIATLSGTPNAPLSPAYQEIEKSANSDPRIVELEKIAGQVPELKSALDALRLQISNSLENGQVVNPSLDFNDPSIIGLFLQEATEKLDPYYKELLQGQTKDLSVAFRTMKEDYDKNIQREQPAFQQQLESQDTSEAERGLAFSSGRVEREQQTIQSQQNRLDDLFTANQRSAEQLGMKGERQIGSRAWNDLGIPTLQSYAASRTIEPRGQITSTGSRQLFTPQGGLFGETPFAREKAINTRAGELASLSSEEDIINRQRKLGMSSIG